MYVAYVALILLIRTLRLKLGVKFFRNYEEIRAWIFSNESIDQDNRFKHVLGTGVR